MDIIQSIVAVRKEQDGVHAQVTVDQDDINKITWHDGNPTNITNEQILAKQAELQADYDAKKYQRDRKYPSIGDQLDMQYWDKINATSIWSDLITKIKSDNPKE